MVLGVTLSAVFAINVAAAWADGGISGNIVDELGDPIEGACVFAGSQSTFDFGTATTDVDGDYVISNLTAGPNYKVTFELTPAFGGGCTPTGDYEGEAWNDKPDINSGDNVTVVEGVTTPTIDAELADAEPAATISGTVTAPNGDPVQGACVGAFDSTDSSFPVAFTNTAANGTYLLSVPAGDYKVGFTSFLSGFCTGPQNLANEFFDNKPDFDSADTITLTPGQARTGVNAQLEAAGAISGNVTSGGNPVQGVCVYAHDPADEFALAPSVTTDASGNYTISGLRAQNYKVEFDPCGAPNLLGEYYNDQPDFDSADQVAVAVGQTTQNINAALSSSGTITGHVTGPAGQDLAGICVTVLGSNQFDFVAFGSTNPSGVYTISGVPAGSYKVQFSSCGPGGNFLTEYYNDRPDFASADAVVVVGGQTTQNIDAALASGGSITGHVTGPAGQDLSGICVNVLSGEFNTAGSATTNGSGLYTVSGLSTGSYKVRFSPCGSGNFLVEFYNDKPTFAAADSVSVTTGQTTANINAALTAGGTISGNVKGPSNQNLQDVCVTAYDANFNDVGFDDTDSNGNYTINGLPAGSYKVEFDPCGAGNFLSEFYNDKPTFATADPVVVTAGQTTSNINGVLAAAGTISGNVKGPGSVNLQNICVTVLDADEDFVDEDDTDASGNYQVTGLPSGNYRVHFSGCGANFIDEYYNDKSTFATADPVAVTAGQTTSNINAILAAGGTISGNVKGPSNQNLQDVCVTAYDANFDEVGFDETDSSGNYTINGLPTASYKVEFDPCGAGSFLREFFNDKPTFGAADPVAVTAGQNTPNINAVLGAAGTITGNVKGPGNVNLDDVCVDALDATTGDFVEGSFTGGTGNYTINGLPAGTYKVQFATCGEDFASEFYNDKHSFGSADPVTVSLGATTPNINAVLTVGSSITGTVTRQGGTPEEDVCVSAIDTSNENIVYAFGFTAANGTYQLDHLASGSYKVFFDVEDCGDASLVNEYYNDKTSFATADLVTVTEPTNTTGINAVLAGGTPTVQRTLTVSRAGTGSGTVAGNGINCGTDCTENYSNGTVVALTATASAGSTFTGWTGCDTPSGNQCTMNMNASKAVTANFTQQGGGAGPQRTLTVVKCGTGTGTVSGTGGGIECGSDCSEAYPDGTALILTAAADAGSTFTGWTNCDNPNGTQCTVTMNADKTVTANFTLTAANDGGAGAGGGDSGAGAGTGGGATGGGATGGGATDNAACEAAKAKLKKAKAKLKKLIKQDAPKDKIKKAKAKVKKAKQAVEEAC
jgi:protocatechuate 3,4-dioxygenase beta subunit